MAYKIGYFAGSLQHFHQPHVSKALIRLAPAELEFTEIPIRDLPLYSPDFDAGFPPAGQAPQGCSRRVRRHPVRLS